MVNLTQKIRNHNKNMEYETLKTVEIHGHYPSFEYTMYSYKFNKNFTINIKGGTRAWRVWVNSPEYRMHTFRVCQKKGLVWNMNEATLELFDKTY